MGGLFGGGKKKSSAAPSRHPTETMITPAPATDPNVIASDQKRRQATETIMTVGIPKLEETDSIERQTLGG